MRKGLKTTALNDPHTKKKCGDRPGGPAPQVEHRAVFDSVQLCQQRSCLDPELNVNETCAARKSYLSALPPMLGCSCPVFNAGEIFQQQSLVCSDRITFS